MRVRIGTERARWREKMTVEAVGVELDPTIGRRVVSVQISGENVTPISIRMTLDEADALASELMGIAMQARIQNEETGEGPKKERL